MVTRCTGHVHCSVTGAARGHYSCLTDIIFWFKFCSCKFVLRVKLLMGAQ